MNDKIELWNMVKISFNLVDAMDREVTNIYLYIFDR